MGKLNYEQDIRIDETALDIEWLEQPQLMLKYAKELAWRSRTVDEAKERIDVVRAEVDRKIRAYPEKYGLEKITEAVVQNTILLQPEYKDALKEYNDERYEYDITRAAVRAFEQRKDALENLVRLHGQQYFAGPRMPRDLTAEKRKREETRKKANAAVGTGMKRRTS